MADRDTAGQWHSDMRIGSGVRCPDSGYLLI